MNPLKKAPLLLFSLALLIPSLAYAHFGTILAQDPILTSKQTKTSITFSFIHPFEQKGMDLEKPETVGIRYLGSKKDREITANLEQTDFLNHKAWSTEFNPQKPGVFCIYMEPTPYWEKSENIFIKHISKTYIGAFGVDQGNWSEPIGLKTEIVPLSRPFGLYENNVFQGKVYFNGKAVPKAEIEVEYYNKDKQAKAENDYMITQVIKADENGVFSYSPPQSGWWGFSALKEADYKIKRKGENKSVELGAVLWVHFLPWNNQ